MCIRDRQEPPWTESLDSLGCAIAVDPHHLRVTSPLFFRPFFRSIFGRPFFDFWWFSTLPGGSQNHQKSPKVDLGGRPFSEPMRCLHFWVIFNDFWWFGGGKKCIFYWQGRQNMQSGQKWAWAVLGAILTSFWLLLGCLGEPKIRQSRFQEGIEKIIDFRDPFFFDFGWFWVPRGAKKKVTFGSFLRLFRSWGLIFLIGRHFGPF